MSNKMTIKQFTKYVNDNASTDELLLEDEVDLWRRSGHQVCLTKELAQEIVDDWNREDPSNYGDRWEILGILSRSAEIAWLDRQDQQGLFRPF
jgi:hypothetical protein